MSRFLRGLWPLTLANVKSFYRDRASLFWTIAFPVLLVVLFGSIFSGASQTTLSVAWVDQDGTAAAAQLRAGFAAVPLLKLRDETEDEALADMRAGKLNAVIVVPAGLGAAIGQGGASGGASGGGPFQLVVYTDPSQQSSSNTVQQVVQQVIGGMNQALTGRPPALGMTTRPLQSQNLTDAAYFVPSILAMALMQLGIFASVPLVGQREKLILKRLNATPLTRATLVASNVFMRLVIAVLQTVIIVAIGALMFGVTIVGSIAVAAGLVVLGAMTFLAIGYVIASYARTEDTANALTSIVQFPLMFLSGIFFPIPFLPEWLRPVASVMPLTYLGDALRQTMVGGAAYAPITFDVLVLAGWLVASFLISARFFRWQ
jgi:ABC-2 type transport system permease protein